MTLATKGRPKNGWTPEAVEALDADWLERVKTEGIFWLFDSLPNNIFEKEDDTPFHVRRFHLLNDFVQVLYNWLDKNGYTEGKKRAQEAYVNIIHEINTAPANHRRIEIEEQKLNAIAHRAKLPFVLMPQRYCENFEEVQEFYERCLELGFEGVVLKKLNGTYLADSGKRNQDWLKYIPHASVDVEVIGFQEGEGKWEGMLGAFLVKMPDGTEMKCSGRLTQEQRRDIWANRDSWMGAIIQMEYRDDKNPVTRESGAVRFGQFIRRRLDKEDEAGRNQPNEVVAQCDLIGE